MPEPGVAQELAAAAALLLRPPDAAVLAALAESTGAALDPVQARQDFYDVLCVPQSGRYIPPYAHVLAKGRVKDGTWWNFPPPRFDGGDALAPWYEAAGFDAMQLDADPMLKGPHRPLDQAGFTLAYLARLVAASEAGTADNTMTEHAIRAFCHAHMETWLDRFCQLLGDSGSPYLRAVAEAVSEAARDFRSCYSAELPDAASVDASRPPSRSAI